jgi:pimeloyl-ACP methyl ester carboxylesterase
MTMTVPATTPDAPAWFRQALADRPEHRQVRVEGVPIAYRVWGDAGAPGVVLVHGGTAHAGWWDHVAPQLAGHRVLAVELSGHGDSGHRDSYDSHQWAREVVAVAVHEGLDRPVVIGHSMGGRVAVTIGVDLPETVSAIAVIDSALNDSPPDEERVRERRRPHRVYPTAAEATKRFRTLPPQDVLLPYVRAHVARASLREVGAGWTWKFDPRVAGNLLRLRDQLPQLTASTILFRCQHGMIGDAMGREMARLVPGGMPVVELPDAGHHPMLDQPLALVTALRTQLAMWPPRVG